MRKRRILPATWPRTTWSLSSFTRNIAFGRASMTSPSNSTFPPSPCAGDRTKQDQPAVGRRTAPLGRRWAPAPPARRPGVPPPAAPAASRWCGVACGGGLVRRRAGLRRAAVAVAGPVPWSPVPCAASRRRRGRRGCVAARALLSLGRRVARVVAEERLRRRTAPWAAGSRRRSLPLARLHVVRPRSAPGTRRRPRRAERTSASRRRSRPRRRSTGAA